MSKGIRHYPDPKRIVDRRLRQGGHGLGVLAAHDYQDKVEMARINKKVQQGEKVSVGEIQEAVRIHRKGAK